MEKRDRSIASVANYKDFLTLPPHTASKFGDILKQDKVVLWVNESAQVAWAWDPSRNSMATISYEWVAPLLGNNRLVEDKMPLDSDGTKIFVDKKESAE